MSYYFAIGIFFYILSLFLKAGFSTKEAEQGFPILCKKLGKETTLQILNLAFCLGVILLWPAGIVYAIGKKK